MNPITRSAIGALIVILQHCDDQVASKLRLCGTRHRLRVHRREQHSESVREADVIGDELQFDAVVALPVGDHLRP